MSSTNNRAIPADETELRTPGEDDGVDKGIPIRDGLYILTNKMARTVLDLCHPKSGTDCHGWSLNRDASIGNQLWIMQKSNAPDTYTLKNFRYSTFLDLWAGQTDDGSRVVGWNHEHGSPNQQWLLAETTPVYYTIQNARRHTYLEVLEGNPANGTKVTCSSAAVRKDHQMWILDRVCASGLEIRDIIQKWKPDLLPRFLLTHGEAAEYFVLPCVLRRSLWEQANLQRQPVRSHLFDYDLFAMKAKTEVHSWAKNAFQPEIPGFGVLFGIIYGEARTERKAYNWYLTQDMCSLVFFDTQTGKEYCAAALDRSGFEPTLAML